MSTFAVCPCLKSCAISPDANGLYGDSDFRFSFKSCYLFFVSYVRYSEHLFVQSKVQKYNCSDLLCY